jgi:hypothetical protein
MTRAQIKALLAAHQTGNAVIYKNKPFHLWMIEMMARDGLLTMQAPYQITDKGAEALRREGYAVNFQIRSRGNYRDGTPWTKLHGKPLASRATAERMLADVLGKMKRIHSEDALPFTFELV